MRIGKLRQMASPDKKIGQARSLRGRMTQAERRLWSRVRGDRFHGLRFLRQEPFGPYIVDFYCSTARLVVELDGDAHAYSVASDKVRQNFIEDQGVKVVRFLNYDVLHHLDAVLDCIYDLCKGHLGGESEQRT